MKKTILFVLLTMGVMALAMAPVNAASTEEEIAAQITSYESSMDITDATFASSLREINGMAKSARNAADPAMQGIYRESFRDAVNETCGSVVITSIACNTLLEMAQ